MERLEGEIAEIIRTACCFGHYSPKEVWNRSLEEAISGYLEQILQSKEFGEYASEWARNQRWQEPE